MSFVNAMNTYNTQTVTGENGAAAHSMYFMDGDTNTKLQGALTAAFNGILRNTSSERIDEFITNIMNEADKAGGNTRINAIVDCFVMWAQCRDRNDGKGERLASYHIFLSMYNYYPKTTLALLRIYPEIGYWKDLSQIYLITTELLKNTKPCDYTDSIVLLQNEIINCFATQLVKDDLNYRHENTTALTLCAKYSPREGGSFDKKTQMAKKIARVLFKTEFKKDFRKAMKEYRRLLANLNKAIDTVEVKECSGNWADIDFNRVPGRALNIKRKAYLNLPSKKNGYEEFRHPDNEDRMICRENLQKHLEKVVNGKISIKGKTMFIHELVQQILENRITSDEEKVLIEAQWNTHIDEFKKIMEDENTSLGKGVCLVDVSGSMSGTPMNVSIAMGIFVSSLGHPLFRDCFISFESTPRWIRLTYPKTYTEYANTPGCDVFGEWDKSRAGGSLSLFEKVRIAAASPWGGSTDFIAAHELILQSCVQAKLPADQLPEWMMILSDMQFNSAFSPGENTYVFLNEYEKIRIPVKTGYNSSFYNSSPSWQPIHHKLSSAYKKAGIRAVGAEYKIPQQIYWNLRGDTVGFPVQSDTPNTQMISGFNVSLLKTFLTSCELDYEQEPEPTPWDTLRNTLDHERYDFIRKICSEIKEKSLEAYIYQPTDGE